MSEKPSVAERLRRGDSMFVSQKVAKEAAYRIEDLERALTASEARCAELVLDAERLRSVLIEAADALDDEQLAAMGDKHPVLTAHAKILRKARAAIDSAKEG